MAKKRISDRERFFKNLTKVESGCWQWKLALDRDGYGLFSVGSQRDNSASRVRAARYAYTELVGPIGDGLQIDHLCKNRACVNPDHLEPVTQHENILRSANTTKVACTYGHFYTVRNTLRTKQGHRHCRACWNLYMRAFKLKRRGQSDLAMSLWPPALPKAPRIGANE